eukprot:gene19346-26784_t
MLGVFACVTATSSGGGSGHYRVAVTEYPVEPALAYSYSYNAPGRMATASSAWSFNYNPAYIPPARNNVKAGLLVRVQNDTTALDPQTGLPRGLSGMEAVVLRPDNTSWERTAEDPRIVLVDPTT